MPSHKASFPGDTLPDKLYYASIPDQKMSAPIEVRVTTNKGAHLTVQPLWYDERPDCLDASVFRQYDRAIGLAMNGIPVTYVLKDCGIHKQVMHVCPVTLKKKFTGILIGLDSPSKGCCPELLTASVERVEGPSEVERLVMEQIRRRPHLLQEESGRWNAVEAVKP